MAAATTLPHTLKLLADATRLRLCALLAAAELSVQELVAITGCAQSRTSNHLALLKRAGIVADRREGTWSFYRLVDPGDDGALSKALFAAVLRPWIESDDGQRDLAAVESVLEQRREKSRSTHDRLAPSWHGSLQSWSSGSLRAEVYAALVPRGLRIADLGCGAGFLAEFLAARGADVIGVDHSRQMLAQARRRVGKRVDFRQGELEALPLASGEVDAAYANLVWHHLADDRRVAAELFRILRPLGRVVISDLLPHGEEWLRDRLGDLRLGVRKEQVLATLARAGFTDLVAEDLHDRYLVTGKDGRQASLPLFLVHGIKPVAAAAKPRVSQDKE